MGEEIMYMRERGLNRAEVRVRRFESGDSRGELEIVDMRMRRLKGEEKRESRDGKGT